jgi:hypothetical protein
MVCRVERPGTPRGVSQRSPGQVAGMVLDATSPAGEGLIEKNQPGFDAVYGGAASYTAGLLHCAFLAAHGPLDWIATDEALAHLSSRGVHRFIKGSGHVIQLVLQDPVLPENGLQLIMW